VKFKGIPVSDGLAVGKCKIFLADVDCEIYSIDNVIREQRRFKTCVAKVKKELLETIEAIEKGDRLNGDEANIFKAHIQILEDPLFYNEIFNRIKIIKKNVESVINVVVKELTDKFEKSGNEVLAERTVDIKDLGYRIISRLTHKQPLKIKDLDGTIIIAKELTPTQLLHLASEGVAGICTEKGGITSHVAILSRSLDIPALSGVKNIVEYLGDGEYIVIDTEENEILFNLSDKELDKYVFLRRQYQKMIKKRRATKKLSSVTKDGKKINLAANLSLIEEVQKMKEYGVNNVGLYRTEFLFMDREDIPSEEEQFRHYKKLGDSFKGDYLVIRTLDAGGDKNISSINNIHEENNPFLGWRGIRICLDKKEVFKTQLKAILRAAAFSNIMLLYPMINSSEQYEKIMEIFDECVFELKKTKTVFNEEIKKGILVEIPSAAYYMDYFSQKIDFFSIGTNDMLQFLLAVDRTNDKISNMYSWYNKALFSIMNEIVTKATKYNKKVQVCGEIASDPLCLPVLIGLGIHSLSMVPSAIPKIKLLLRSFSVDECKEITNTVLNMDRDTEIKSFLSGRFKEFMGREELINEMSEMWEGK